MTLIAVMTVPLAVLATGIGLYYTGNTLNVMTLAGLSLSIGPLVDLAIICLENTHRHLGLGTGRAKRRFWAPARWPYRNSWRLLHVVGAGAAGADAGSGGVSVPADGHRGGVRHGGRVFVVAEFRAGAVRSGCRAITITVENGRRGSLQRLFAAWERVIGSAIQWYCRRLDWVLQRRIPVVAGAFLLLVADDGRFRAHDAARILSGSGCRRF